MIDLSVGHRRNVNRAACQSQRALVFALTALLLCSHMADRIQAAGGDLDPTFGSGGKVITDLATNAGASALAIQPDGKVIVAGTTLTTSFTADFIVVRYNTNGSLDNSFGLNGKVTTDFLGGNDVGTSVAIQQDGKIIAAGATENEVGLRVFGLARYNADGSVDSTFGSGGKVTTNISGITNAISSLALQPDGKIIAAGFDFSFDTENDFALARYNPDGSPDLSFGSGGRVVTDFFAEHDSISGIALQQDGKIVAVGSAGIRTQPGNILRIHFAIARYKNDGGLDGSFGSGGKVLTDFGVEVLGFLNASVASAVALQSDGKVLVAGLLFNNNPSIDFALARYNVDGALDSSFGSGGKVVTDFGNRSEGYAIAIQPNNKAVVAGVVYSSGTNPDFALARYNSDGGLDSSFGSNGKVSTDFGARDDARALALQPDGKLVAAGLKSSESIGNDIALARYNGDVASFDICLEDDSSGRLLQLNSTTGAYQFTNCAGFSITGIGALIKRGGVITLQDFSADRKVVAKIDTAVNKASAGIQIYSQGATFTIADRNTTNNTCMCR